MLWQIEQQQQHRVNMNELLETMAKAAAQRAQGEDGGTVELGLKQASSKGKASKSN